MKGLFFRNVVESDYNYVISVVNDWWNGRNMAPILPRLFFQHFQNTSFVAVKEGGKEKIVGFIIGFVSQTKKDEGYIHFVGVDPDYRKKGVGNELYQLFFNRVRELGCVAVSCVTSPVNQLSIAFHQRLGFTIQPGNSLSDNGVPVTANYDGSNEARVRFTKEI